MDPSSLSLNGTMLFKHTGFPGIDIALNHHVEPCCLVTTICTTAVELSLSLGIILLFSTYHRLSVFFLPPKILALVKQKLENSNFHPIVMGFSIASETKDSRLISLWTLIACKYLSSPKLTLNGSRSLFFMLSRFFGCRMAVYLKASRPSAALMKGFITSIATENLRTKVAALDLEPMFDDLSVDIVTMIVQQEHVL